MGIWNEAATLLIKLIAAVITVLLGEILLPWVKHHMVPWLRERRLLTLVSVFVQAAEKMAESGQISKEDKLGYVVTRLEDKDIVVTPEVRAFIESAVIDLDKALSDGLKKVAGEITVD